MTGDMRRHKHYAAVGTACCLAKEARDEDLEDDGRAV